MEGDEDNEDVGSMDKKKRRKPRQKRGDDAVNMVTRSDGRIWIPEITGRNRTEMQNMVRGFLTSHYRMSTSYITALHEINCFQG